MALTHKQRRFVEEYMVDGNATQAAVRSGYSEDTARQMGAENLSKPVIAAAIRDAENAKAAECGVTAEWITRQLKAEAEDHGEDSSHAARVSALKVLAQTRGMLVKKVETTASVRVEVVEELIDADGDRPQDGATP